MAGTDLFRLDGRTALVTGASRGLGAAIARALAHAGADIVVHASREQPETTAAAIRASCRSRCACITGDLAHPDGPSHIAAEAERIFGRIDILVNNAGIIRRAPAAEYSDEDWNAVLEVNASSVFRLSRAIARGMLERGAGKIINIASLLSFQGGIRVPAYAAAKGAVAQLTKALANEWASRGICVNAIAPGYFRTDNTQPLIDDEQRYKDITARIPAGRWGEPDDLAGAAVFLASPASDYVHGHILVVDGGWMAR